jgi:hypothetical protein
MKKNSVILLLLSLLSTLALSCVRDGADVCEAELTLRFHIEQRPDAEFVEHIQSVEVFLFDSVGNIHTRRRLERGDLDESLTTTFVLDPGRYHAICWANEGDNTDILSTAETEDGLTIDNGYIEIVTAATGDKIWYTPDRNADTAVEVPIGKTLREMTFTKVHRTVEVYVRYDDDIAALFEGRLPVVRMVGAGGRYDFRLNPDLTPITLEQTTVDARTPEGTMPRAEFHSKRVPVRSDMDVVLCHPISGAVLATQNLEQYIASENITDDSFISIMFEGFRPEGAPMDVWVTVGLPPWLDNPVEGESQL